MFAHHDVRAGKRPKLQRTKSVWKRPPASSSCRRHQKPPITTKGAKSAGDTKTPAIPIPIAPASDIEASAISERSDSCVFSGRPLSSSSAWAAPPTAEKGAKRGQQAINMDLGRSCRAERDVGEMPRRIGRMEQRDQITPAARAQGVEGGAIKPSAHHSGENAVLTYRVSPRSQPAPHPLACTDSIPAARQAPADARVAGADRSR